MQFMIYGTRPSKDKSGAYLFLPDGKAKVFPQRLCLRCSLAFEKPLVCIVASHQGVQGRHQGHSAAVYLFIFFFDAFNPVRTPITPHKEQPVSPIISPCVKAQFLIGTLHDT